MAFETITVERVQASAQIIRAITGADRDRGLRERRANWCLRLQERLEPAVPKTRSAGIAYRAPDLVGGNVPAHHRKHQLVDRTPAEPDQNQRMVVAIEAFDATIALEIEIQYDSGHLVSASGPRACPASDRTRARRNAARVRARR